MNDQYRTSDLACGLEDIDRFQILKQRQIKPVAIVEGKAPVPPFLQRSRLRTRRGKASGWTGAAIVTRAAMSGSSAANSKATVPPMLEPSTLISPA